MRKLCEKITDELAGLSVESGLKRCFFMSDGHISRLKRRPEGITLNGKKAYTTATLSAGDMLCAEICDGETVRPTPMDMPLVVLYEDEDIVIIDKPAGVAVHSSTRNPEELTLENAFSARLKEGENFHPVSRLDRGTTGIMTVAKNGYMHHRLKRIMHTEEFRREYVGISVGRVEPESGRIELPIGFEQGSRYAVVTTGSEVAKGRIPDSFTPVVERKLAALGIRMTEHVLVEDGIENVAAAIEQMKNKPVDMILCTGGMSVDPDDSTPGAIKQSGADIVTYGAPVLPGAMFLLGYYADGRPVMGLPGCVMYAKATIFDLVLPRIAAGVRLTRRDFVALGEGGLCLGCEVCTYPHCGFGGV